MNRLKILLFFLVSHALTACAQNDLKQVSSIISEVRKIELPVIGNEQTDLYLPLLEGKKIGLVGNHTSVLGGVHMVDSLLSLDLSLVKVFSPEHGFRGTADAGEKVKHQVDEKTKLPIVSLYGTNKKPTVNQLKGVEVILFDIQDVGVRFYTYISTLHYVMEAAAENKIPLILLDRPNPNGHYVDGPVLNKKYKSFVGMHPVPVVHGMTIGEYAQMINQEGWLKDEIQCDLTIIKNLNYDHKTSYNILIPPSPNLPNMKSVYLYPSLCFFEGTPISIGRGTDKPFQQVGHPDVKGFNYSFTPQPNFGARTPKLNNEKCFGIDLSVLNKEQLRKEKYLKLNYLLEFYDEYPRKEEFFTEFFNLLAGNNRLQAAIASERSEAEIRLLWKTEIAAFKKIRRKYLLYPDFE